MTLIFSHRSPITGLFALSDTVVSTLPKYAQEIELPFRADTLSHHAKGYALKGLQQKTTIARRTMLMWAGSAIVARALFEVILEKSDAGGDLVDIREIMSRSGLSEQELGEISLIYH